MPNSSSAGWWHRRAPRHADPTPQPPALASPQPQPANEETPEPEALTGGATESGTNGWGFLQGVVKDRAQVWNLVILILVIASCLLAFLGVVALIIPTDNIPWLDIPKAIGGLVGGSVAFGLVSLVRRRRRSSPTNGESPTGGTP